MTCLFSGWMLVTSDLPRAASTVETVWRWYSDGKVGKLDASLSGPSTSVLNRLVLFNVLDVETTTPIYYS